MHLLEGLRSIISGDALCFDVFEEVLDQMHLREVPAPLFVVLIIRVY